MLVVLRLFKMVRNYRNNKCVQSSKEVLSKQNFTLYSKYKLKTIAYCVIAFVQLYNKCKYRSTIRNKRTQSIGTINRRLISFKTAALIILSLNKMMTRHIVRSLILVSGFSILRLFTNIFGLFVILRLIIVLCSLNMAKIHKTAVLSLSRFIGFLILKFSSN